VNSSEEKTKHLIELFIARYNEEFGCAYRDPEWLDDLARESDGTKERVEVIYSQNGNKLAIEHTLVERFPSEKYERALLDSTFGFLSADTFLACPEFYISVGVPVGELRALGAQKRKELRLPVEEWLKRAAGTLNKRAGWQYQQVRLPGTLFDVTLSAEFLAGYSGSISAFGAHAPLGNGVLPMVRTALKKKLRKLVRAVANERFLFLEKDLRAYRTSELAEAIRLLEPEFPDLKSVDQVWHLDTSERDRQHTIVCHKVWPDSHGIGFFVRESGPQAAKDS
jgi:hypothetical protein